MRIEYHNAHGNQLILTLTEREAIDVIHQVSTALTMMLKTNTSHYAEFKTEFENDNDRWVPTDLDVMVVPHIECASPSACRPAFPCGKPVVEHPYCPDGPCSEPTGHDGPCFIRSDTYSLP